MKRIGIIGTAGRDQFSQYLTWEVYSQMVRTAMAIVDAEIEAGEKVELVSGGAAWADHIAVVLKRAKPEDYDLSLKLPCVMEGPSPSAFQREGVAWTADAANKYHRQMSEKLGYDTLHELWEISMNPYVNVEIYPGFKPRDMAIARSVDKLIAFTFSDTGQPPPRSGTLFTWNKAPDRVEKINVNIMDLVKQVQEKSK